MNNFLGKYNLTIWNQEKNKNLNKIKPVKKNLKFKIYPKNLAVDPDILKTSFIRLWRNKSSCPSTMHCGEYKRINTASL